MINPKPLDIDAQLLTDFAGMARDPLAFALYAFPWGEAGDLESSGGPRRWQRKILQEMTDSLASIPNPPKMTDPLSHKKQNQAAFNHCLQLATASGHDIGKSALVSMIIWWGMCTMEDTRIVVTANTDTQLKTKTWPEVAKWYRLLICRHWFRMTATSISSMDPDHERTWRADAIPWNEQRTESFAGLHNEGKRILVIFDEASAIHDAIWEVTEGALTDSNTEMFWLCFGNPTRNTGRFRDCFTRLKHRWVTHQIDSLTVEDINHTRFEQMVEDYGEDSDFVRVRVRGLFPRAGTNQFIPSDSVESAMDPDTEYTCQGGDAYVLGVDVARFGDDESVVFARQGRDARNTGMWTYRGLDTMQLAAQVARLAGEAPSYPDAIFVDEGGVGGGVVDRLRQLGYSVIGVNFGARADMRGHSDFGNEGEQYSNKRAEIWGSMRQWLKQGAMLPDDAELMAQLIGPEYGLNLRGEIQLERKADMKKRGIASPDRADALALTFAYPVAAEVFGDGYGRAMECEHDWNPIA